MTVNHFGLGGPKSVGNVFADKTSVVSADMTSVASLCQKASPKASPLVFLTQGRPLRGRPCVGNVGGGCLGRCLRTQ